jgi:hypothetical protein
MARQVLRLGLSGAIAVILLALAYRLRQKPVIDAVRVFNKHVTNPPMIALAGRRYWYAAVIRHEGRRSGKEYATPVKAVPVEGGFVVPLSYVESVKWLKKMFAAGHATIESRGTTYAVVEQEVIGAEAAAAPQAAHVAPVRSEALPKGKADRAAVLAVKPVHSAISLGLAAGILRIFYPDVTGRISRWIRPYFAPTSGAAVRQQQPCSNPSKSPETTGKAVE